MDFCTFELGETQFHSAVHSLLHGLNDKVHFDFEWCCSRKANPQKAAPKENTPFAPLNLDCLSHKSDSRDICGVLVITDHFTKFTVALPPPKTVAKAKRIMLCAMGFLVISTVIRGEILSHRPFKSSVH